MTNEPQRSSKGHFAPKDEQPAEAAKKPKLPTWASTILVLQALAIGGCGLAGLEGGLVVIPCFLSHIVVGALFHIAASLFAKENRAALRNVANYNLYLTPVIPLGIGLCDFGGPLFMWHGGFVVAAVGLLILSRR